MILAFRQPAVADCVISIGYNSDLLNPCPKIKKSWQDEIRPIISRIKGPKLSIYFHLARNSYS